MWWKNEQLQYMSNRLHDIFKMRGTIDPGIRSSQSIMINDVDRCMFKSFLVLRLRLVQAIQCAAQMGAVLQPCTNKTDSDVTEFDLEYNETKTNAETSKKKYRRARRDSTTIRAFVRTSRKPSVIESDGNMASKFDATSYYSDRPEMEAKKEMGKVVMQQVMLRIKDPKRSLDVYTKVLGMTLLIHRDFPQVCISFTLALIFYYFIFFLFSPPSKYSWGCISLTLALVIFFCTQPKVLRIQKPFYGFSIVACF